MNWGFQQFKPAISVDSIVEQLTVMRTSLETLMVDKSNEIGRLNEELQAAQHEHNRASIISENLRGLLGLQR